MSDLSRFKAAFKSADLDALVAEFAVDAAIHSPFTTHPLVGHELVRLVLGTILDVLQEPDYSDELVAADGTRALVVNAHVDDHAIEIVDLIRFDAGGRINDFTVFARPRTAGEALFKEVGPRIAKGLGSAVQ